MKPLPELQRNTDNRFTYFMCKSDENQIDQTWGKKQPETTEVDLILVVLTLSGCVTAVGALAFSHYEGKLPPHFQIGNVVVQLVLTQAH